MTRPRIAPRRQRFRSVVLAPGKASAGYADAGVTLAAGGDSDVGTAATPTPDNKRLRCIPRTLSTSGSVRPDAARQVPPGCTNLAFALR